MTQARDGSGNGEHAAAASPDRRYLAIALGIILCYMAAEVVIAFFAHSLALLADAGHMLTDAGALAGAMWAMRLASRPSSATMSFGLKRAEILSAAANGVTLVAVGLLLLVEAIQRLVEPSVVQGGLMMIVAGVGVVANLTATFVLAKGNRRSLNVEGAFQHILTDLYGIGATAVAGLVILLSGWNRADPIAALAVVVLVFRAGWGLLRASGRILLEGTPESVDLDEVRRHIHELPEVVAVHDLHAWTLTSDLPALTAHVVVTDACLRDGSAATVLDRLQLCLTDHFDVEHSTFQLEAARHGEHEPGTHD